MLLETYTYQALSNPSTAEVDDLQAIIHSEELLTVDACWGRWINSLLSMWPLVGFP